MLSIILYGRNDSHGYNLHKRAAISFNSIAELMTDPDDEIVFVDYNTPDDLPTFPEAIHDTLTAKAIERLRVIRVRQRHHLAFQSKSHLVALEPVARNVALRRTNPANRWVLSTNTDMIFAPVRSGQSLSDIVGRLNDGYYHLPRFELPECLWEAFDRKDGPGIVEQTRNWGTRFHLNEIVYSGADNLYDAPGDFQLALRSDLFEIHGFHEEMLLGWHVDANIARRMRMVRGKVSTLAEQLTGYHCDHTRQSTAVHKRDRVENDQARFVHNVVQPGIPSQEGTWGLNGADLEEIRLGAGASVRYVNALRYAIHESAKAVYEARYATDSYNVLDYPAEHVLPYVADLLSCSPLGARIGYAGVRKDMFDLVSKALVGLDATAIIEPAPSCSWLRKPQTLSRTDAEWADVCDLYIFEAGETPGIDEAGHILEGQRLSRIFTLFRSFAQREEARQIDSSMSARRVIAINAIHTYFEILVSNAVAHTTTPFSSRVRHGYVAPDRLPKNVKLPALDLAKVGEVLAIQMGRSYVAPVSEVRRLIDIACSLPVVAEADTPEWTLALNVADPLLTLIRDGRTMAAIPRDPSELTMIADVLEAHRPSSLPSRGLAAFPLRDEPSEAATRLADINDWDRPSWLSFARRYWRAKGVHDYFVRDAGAWEQTTLLDELDRQYDFASRSFSDRPRILVVAHETAYIAACLIDAGAQVDIVDPLYLLDELSSVIDWRPNLRDGFLKTLEPIGAFAEEVEAGRAKPYDAIVFPNTSAFIRGRTRVPDLVACLHPWIKEGGIFAITGVVRIEGETERHMLPRCLALQGRLATGMEEAAGFRSLRGFDFALSRRTADSRARPGAQPAGYEPFISGANGLSVRGVWFWKTASGARLNRPRLVELFSEEDPLEDDRPISWVQPATTRARSVEQTRFVSHERPMPSAAVTQTITNGNQMSRAQPVGPAKRTPRGIQIEASNPPGVFATVPCGIAAPGPYELMFEVHARAGSTLSAKALTIEVVSGDAVIATAQFSVGDLAAKSRRSLEFVVPVRRGGTGVKLLEARMVHNGACDLQLLSLSTYSGARV